MKRSWYGRSVIRAVAFVGLVTGPALPTHAWAQEPVVMPSRQISIGKLAQLKALEASKDFFLSQHDYERAGALAQKALVLSKSLYGPSDPAYLEVALNASAIFAEAGDPKVSEQIIGRALDEARESKENVEALSDLRINGSRIHDRDGHHAVARNELGTNIRNLNRFGRLGTKAGVMSLTDLATIAADEGQALEAETLAAKAIELMNEQKGMGSSDPDFIRAYAALGSSNVQREGGSLATGPLEFSVEQYGLVNRKFDGPAIELTNRLFRAYLDLGLISAAARTADDFQKLYDAVPQEPGASFIHAARCAVLRQRGKPEQALESCKKAVSGLWEFEQIRVDGLRASTELCRTYQALRRPADALNAAVASLEKAVALGVDGFAYKLETSRLTACGLSSLSRPTLLSDTDLHAADILLRAVQLIKRPNDADKVARIRELRGIADDGARRRALELEYLTSRRKRAEDRLLSLALSTAEFIESNRTIERSLEVELAMVQARAAALGTDSTAPALPATLQPVAPSASLIEVQRRLGPRDAIVLYTELDGHCFAILIRKTAVLLHEVSAEPEELRDLIERITLHGSLATPKVRRGPLEGFDPKAASRLYDLLWKPLRPWVNLESTDRVYAILDGKLAGLPFPSLLSSPANQVSTLEDVRALPFFVKSEAPVVLTPDLTSWVASEPHRIAKPRWFVGVGNPVPPPCAREENALLADATSDAIDIRSLCAPAIDQTGEELESVAKLFARKSVLAGPDGSERAVRTLNDTGVLRQATLIIFATHALAPGELQIYADPQRLDRKQNFGVPLVGKAAANYLRRYSSAPAKALEAVEQGSFLMQWLPRNVADNRYTFPPGLILTAPTAPTSETTNVDSRDDGFLSSSEIASLDLDADLVILSACNSAATETPLANAVISGMPRAFLAAGAKSVLVTRWSVASAPTRDFITAFVTRAESNAPMPRDRVLQTTMQATLAGSTDPHPFLWAPFVLAGGALPN